MASRYYYGTGRRKTSVARVRLYPGQGDIIINDKALSEYFQREADRLQVRSPLEANNLIDQFNVMVKVRGGVSADRRERFATASPERCWWRILSCGLLCASRAS